MYRKILVALENSKTDEPLIAEIGKLASILGSQLLLAHIADGWVARNFDQLKLAESDEMRDDRQYLEDTATMLRGKNLVVETVMGLGDPATGILKLAEEEQCDLIALASHGHRLLADFIHGQTIEKVRHLANVPLFIVSPKR